MLPLDQSLLVGIFFLVVLIACECVFLVMRQLAELDAKSKRIASLTVALEEANARADGAELRTDMFLHRNEELYHQAGVARLERDDALGKLGALGALVRDAARNGSELN